MNCRHCGCALHNTFLDLGFAPPSNAYLSPDSLYKPETHFPLRLLVCSTCWLVQTDDYASAEQLFDSDYAYFSSISTSWLTHAKSYCEMITKRLALSSDSHVIEVASNDGYLLKNFVANGIPCTGIEPTASTADAAEKLGIPVIRDFFGKALAQRLAHEGRQADLILGNNVYAHVPDINDFTKGLKLALKPSGTITLEFPHLMQLLSLNQFDTVYHEHFSYLSLYSVSRIFAAAGLRIFDVERLPTHGGSLRVYGCHFDDSRSASAAVESLLKAEAKFGLQTTDVYAAFQARANKVKDDFVSFLIQTKQLGGKVIAYGAAAKGCTLINYAGIKPDLLPAVCDNAPSKQGKLLPGAHIPILAPSVIRDVRPEYIVILPWNIRDEVMEQLSFTREWGARFVTAVPELQVS